MSQAALRASGRFQPPTFIVHGTRLKELQESYKRYLENFFRKRFKLIGTPVSFIFREVPTRTRARRTSSLSGRSRPSGA